MKYIITFNEQSKKLCFSELNNLNCDFYEIEKLNLCQSIINLQMDAPELLQCISSTPIIFVRHLIKIDKEFNKQALVKDICDYILSNIQNSKTFSLQYQTNVPLGEKMFNMDEFVAEISKSEQIKFDVKNPEQIASIFETKNKYYIGIGNKSTNLSIFKGGMPHFSKQQEFISRAEYKLSEALNLSEIDISKMTLAADLGAAPGGWTKVLCSNGMEVHSIDPANIDKNLKSLPNVKHFQMTTEKYLQKFTYTNFDIVVNDMKMDVDLSVKIINQFYPRIKPNGYVIMTFKLQKDYSYKQIKEQINILKQKYKLILARQLFHNRSEITVVLQKN